MNRQGLNWHDVHYCNADDQLLMIEIKPMLLGSPCLDDGDEEDDQGNEEDDEQDDDPDDDPDYVEIDGEGQGTIASASWLVANEQTD